VEAAMPMVLWNIPASPPAPQMAGPMAVSPRIVTQATVAGELLTYPPDATPAYASGDRMEVLRALRLAPDTIVYLVLLSNGCTGWIPAGNVSFGMPMIAPGYGHHE
jgi:hypothetical protein